MGSFLAGVPARRAALEDRHRPWRSRTVSALLDSVVADYPYRPFVITEHGTLSYAELAGRAARLARGLVASGVLPGERVGLYLPNGADMIAARSRLRPRRRRAGTDRPG